jgi:hypothetical protein
VGVLLGALPVGAPPAVADDPGLLRIAHLSPDTPALDVAVTPAGDGPLTDPGPDQASGLRYGDVGPYAGLAAGSYAVSIRAAGTSRTGPPALSALVEVPAGGARTVAISGAFADLSLRPLTDDLSPPPAGAARVRVLAAAAGVPTLDVAVAGGPVLAGGLPFGSAGAPVAVPAGDAVLLVDGAPVGAPLDLAAGSVVSLLVLDDPAGGITLRPVLDAAGPAAVPVGAVEAGGGRSGVPAVLASLTLTAALAAARGRARPLVALTVLVAAALSVPAAPADPAPQRSLSLSADARPAVPAPVRLRVPAAGVDSPLTGIGLPPSGALVPPAGATTAGWYADGPTPGATGPAVIAGHVDWAGRPGTFARLREISPGDTVLVDRADGSTVGFTVTRVERAAKGEFPTGAVYGPTPDAQLRLITCGGSFDRAAGSYADNVVVYATAH